MSDPKYRVCAESLDELAAKLVYLLKLENNSTSGPNAPRIDKLNILMGEGSKVSITLSKKPADGNCRRGIEIDGYTLG